MWPYIIIGVLWLLGFIFVLNGSDDKKTGISVIGIFLLVFMSMFIGTLVGTIPVRQPYVTSIDTTSTIIYAPIDTVHTVHYELKWE